MIAFLPLQLFLIILVWRLVTRPREGRDAWVGIAIAGCLILLSIHFAIGLVDLLLGEATVESAVGGMLPFIDEWTPLSTFGLVGRAAHWVFVFLAFSATVGLIRWATLTGRHLEEPDREQARARWLRLAGRGPSGRLERPLRAALGPITTTLGLALVVSLIVAVVTGSPPTGGDWAISELVFVTLGAALWIVAPPSAKQVEGSATNLTPAPSIEPLASRVMNVLRTAGLEVRPLPIRNHEGGDWEHVKALALQGREGRSAILCGPSGSGRTTAVVEAALSLAVDRFECGLVLTADDDSAERVRGQIGRRLDDLPVPGIVRVVCPTDGTGHVGLGTPSIVVLAAQRLPEALGGAHGVGDWYFEALSTVLIDDLDSLDASSAGTLRRALDLLRSRRRVAGELVCLATASPRGRGQPAWCSAIVGASVEVVVANPPRPATTGLLLLGGAPALRSANDCLAAAGLPTIVHDAVHADRTGPSFAPWPAVSGPRRAPDEGARSEVVLVGLRHRDLALVGERFAPVGEHSEAVVIACPFDIKEFETPGGDDSKSEVDTQAELEPRWVPLLAGEATSHAELVLESDSGVIGHIDTRLARLHAVPRARVVAAGVACRVRTAADGRIVVYAEHTGDSGPVLVERDWSIQSSEVLVSRQIHVPRLNLKASLALSRVEVRVEAKAIESRDGDFVAREILEPPETTMLSTIGLRISAEGHPARALRERVARSVFDHTTLREDEVEVFAGEAAVWIVELAPSGHGACAWLLDHAASDLSIWIGAATTSESKTAAG